MWQCALLCGAPCACASLCGEGAVPGGLLQTCRWGGPAVAVQEVVHAYSYACTCTYSFVRMLKHMLIRTHAQTHAQTRNIRVCTYAICRHTQAHAYRQSNRCAPSASPSTHTARTPPAPPLTRAQPTHAQPPRPHAPSPPAHMHTRPALSPPPTHTHVRTNACPQVDLRQFVQQDRREVAAAAARKHTRHEAPNKGGAAAVAAVAAARSGALDAPLEPGSSSQQMAPGWGKGAAAATAGEGWATPTGTGSHLQAGCGPHLQALAWMATHVWWLAYGGHMMVMCWLKG